MKLPTPTYQRCDNHGGPIFKAVERAKDRFVYRIVRRLDNLWKEPEPQVPHRTRKTPHRATVLRLVNQHRRSA